MHGGARSALLGLALLGTLAPGVALAQQRGQTTRVAVAPFAGRRADEVRYAAVEGLLAAPGIGLVSDDAVAEAAGSFTSAPERPADWARFARAAHADAIIAGDVMVDRTEWMAVVRARSATDGSVLAEERVRGRGPMQLDSRVRAVVRDRIAPALLHGGAATPLADETAPFHEPETVTEEDTAAARREALDDELFPGEAPAVDDGPPRSSPLEARAGLRLFHRSLDFSDTTMPERPYRLPLGPAFSLSADWYPAAHFRNGPLANLGVSVLFEHAIALDSAGPDGMSYDTGSTRTGIGARYRLPLGRSEIAGSLGYVYESYSIETAPTLGEPAFASVGYGSIRVGAAGRLSVSDRIALSADVAWLFVTGEGELGGSRWYPDASSMGFDASIGGSYAICHGLGLAVTLDYRQYMVDLGAGSGGQSNGSAVDRFFGGHVFATYTLDPAGGAAAH